MKNPFEEIDARLSNIENILLDIKHQPTKKEEKTLKEKEEKYLTVKETAQFLNLTIPTIYSKISRKELSNFKRGKNVYFSKKLLIEYLEKGKRKSNEEIEKEVVNFITKKKCNNV